MLSEKLKNETLSQHQQLEKRLVTRIKNATTTADYIDILQLFYGYFGGLEQYINQFIGSSQLADYTQRRKTDAIAQDIKTLGADPVTIAQNYELPQINSLPEAFGAMYVIEGSTLGGSIISKMISSRLGISNGLSFFNGYGEKTQQMWEEFRNKLNQIPTESQTQQAVITAANNTFIKFSNWIDRHGQKEL
ncbi:biliverdin-producing heme oxygenase [Mucilaginibacter sp. KACC 22063]|uniref:biliverdin-producing heme oxygenase n=1 Tax=Mucilaginibacter sp. KACC 22063 TaxID=3025666 RepID=UPI0023672B37|nr:biliverdin-producing heme oxygenase [Mucilaginibacter sp. KACC 22063]WDF55467.1 biliverdin-producing heme oxygenase [Mucilaginibacter sp. KACC 22063]